MNPVNKKILKIYEIALTSRYLDERMQEYYYRIRRGVLFSGVGAELGPSIISAHLLRKDYLIPRYRGFAAVLGKGIKVEKIVAEMMRKRSGTTMGIGDTSSFRATGLGIPGYSTILGAMFSVEIGLALAIKLRKGRNIVVHFFGDGESSRSQFGSALNLASLWKLPILFVCENNNISVNIGIREMSSTKTVAERGRGYNVPSETLKETDYSLLLQRVPVVIEAVRKQQTPFLLELLQKRFPPHYSGLSNKPFYGKGIPPGEDPIVEFENFLIKNITKKEQEDIRRRVYEKVNVAFRKAFRDSTLSPEEFFSIYYE